MGFGIENNSGSSAKTQADLVNERMQSKPKLENEEMFSPGLPQIHTMGESALIAFFTMILKSRTSVRSLDLTLGSTYECTERLSSVPRSNTLHTLGVEDVARTLTMALAQGGGQCVGFRAVIESDSDGEVISRIFLKIASKDVHGPTFNAAGEVELEGDPEFAPQLYLGYRP